jgi:outer membrane murein-binding lipoprotein Lpp
MLSEAQQKRVWEGMLSSEIRSNYFADFSGRYYARQRWATWGALVASSGAVVAVLADLPDSLAWLRIALPLATAALSGYSVVAQNQKYAVDAADLHSRWNRLAKDYEKLWENVYANDAQETLSSLDDRAVELSKAGAGFKYDERSMLRWQEQVERHRLAHA